MAIERSDLKISIERLYKGTYIARVDTPARDDMDGAGGRFCQAFTINQRRSRWAINPPPIYARSEITFDTLSDAKEGCLSMVARLVVPSFRELAGFEFYRSDRGNLVYTGETDISGLTCYVSVERDPDPGGAWSILVSRGALVHVEASAPSHPQINDAVRRALDKAREIFEAHQATVIIAPDAAAEIAQVTAETARLRAENEAREARHDAEIAAMGALFNAPVQPTEQTGRTDLEILSDEYSYSHALAIQAYENRLALEEPARDPQDTPVVAMDVPSGYMRPCESCSGSGVEQNGDYLRPCSACDGSGIDREPAPDWLVSDPPAAPWPAPLSHDAQAVLGFAQELIRAVEARAALNAHQQQAFAELYSLARAYDRWAEETKGEES